MLKLIKGGKGLTRQEWQEKCSESPEVQHRLYIFQLLTWRACIIGCPDCQRVGLCMRHGEELEAMRTARKEELNYD